MAVLTKNLYVQKTGRTAVACNIYSTTAEVGSNYLSVNVDGTNGYVKLGSTNDTYATSGRVMKGSTTYAICSSAIEYKDGTLLSENGAKFTVPAGCNYISINAIYYTENGMQSESSGIALAYYSMIVDRVKVTPGTIIDLTTGVDGFSSQNYPDYYFGADPASLVVVTRIGAMLKPTNISEYVPTYSPTYSTHYKVYYDNGEGSPYADELLKEKYKVYYNREFPA